MIKTGPLKRLARMIGYRFLCSAFPNRRRGHRSSLEQRLARSVPENENRAVTLSIYGKIARVGFRSWLRQKARLHQLESLVFYRAPHILGVVLAGSQESLDSVVREAWQGPARARVYRVREKWYNRQEPGELEEIEADPRRTRETINLLKEALDYLGPVMEKTNRFPVKGKYSNAVELARAAEERSLFIARLGNVNYVVSPQKELGLQQSQSSRVSSLVRSLTDHKHLAKDYLAARGLPVPEGRLFDAFDPAAEYLKQSGRPLVVKPLQGSYGLGISVDVRTAGELGDAFNYARQYHELVILEEYVQGLDIRILVIGGRARAALLRVPAHVVGDGKSSIDRLILQKNKVRFKNPRLGKAPIIPDLNIEKFLAQQGYSLESIPEKGEVIFLRLKANIGAGADSVVLTGQIHPDLMRLAEEAAAAFGVVDFWGVDLLVERIDRPREEQRCVILEINSRANIFNVQFPLYGEPFDAAGALIDSLFPEDSSDSAYPLASFAVEIMGRLSPRFFRRSLAQARKLALQGFIRPAGSTAEAVIGGRKHQVLSFLDWLWGRQESDWLVDGFRLAAHSDAVEGPFKVKQERDGITNCTALPRPDLKEVSRQVHLPEPGGGAFEEELNTALFLSELAERGCSAEPMGEGLLKIKKDNRQGITNIYFSSLFCDKACENINPVKKMLALKGIPVLRGLRFKLSEMNRALRYFEILKSCCTLTVIHPQGNYSLPVNSKSGLITAWREAVSRGIRYLIIEERLPGRNICAAVVAGQFAGAQMLLPLSLCGDGERTLTRLLEEKNEARLMNPWYRSKPLPAAGYFEKRFSAAGCRLEEVPPRGKVIALESEAVLELGGESAGLEDELHRDFKDLAVKMVEAVPGLELAFVHLIIPDPAEAAAVQRWAVRRIDPRPAAASFHFPWAGRSHNLAKKIVTELCFTERTLWK